jgi:hypothetical protein
MAELVQLSGQTRTYVLVVLNNKDSAPGVTVLDHLVENFGSGEISRRAFPGLKYERFADRVAEYIRGKEALRAKPVRSFALRREIFSPGQVLPKSYLD